MFQTGLLSAGDRRSLVLCLLLAAVIGLLVRVLVGTVLNYGYDVHHWALVMSNISSGNGLYDITGYFYTPVWGYFLAFFDLLQQSFLSLGETAFRVTDALEFEGYEGYISANTTSLEYAFWVKLPLYLVDLLVAVLLYRLVLGYTQDCRKAAAAFVLWIFNPLVICAPAVQGMFDNVTVLLTLICYMCLQRRYYFTAGTMLALAVLLKLFPVFLLPLLVAYLMVKEGRGLRRTLPYLLSAAAGFLLVTFVVFLPQALDGTLDMCFTFITARAGSGADAWHRFTGVCTVLIYVGIALGSVVVAASYYAYAEGDLDGRLLTAVLVVLTLMFLYPPTPQYLVLLMPFLIAYVVIKDRSFRRPLAVISIGATGYILANGFSLLLSLACGTDLMSVDTVVSLAHAYRPYWYVLYYGSAVVQYLGILWLAYSEIKGRVMRIIPPKEWGKVFPGRRPQVRTAFIGVAIGEIPLYKSR